MAHLSVLYFFVCYWTFLYPCSANDACIRKTFDTFALGHPLDWTLGFIHSFILVLGLVWPGPGWDLFRLIFFSTCKLSKWILGLSRFGILQFVISISISMISKFRHAPLDYRRSILILYDHIFLSVMIACILFWLSSLRSFFSLILNSRTHWSAGFLLLLLLFFQF